MECCSGIGYTKYNFYIFTTVQLASTQFIGAFGTWTQIPDFHACYDWIEQKIDGISATGMLLALNVMVRKRCFCTSEYRFGEIDTKHQISKCCCAFIFTGIYGRLFCSMYRRAL